MLEQEGGGYNTLKDIIVKLVGYIMKVNDVKCLISVVGVLQGLCFEKEGRKCFWGEMIDEDEDEDEDRDDNKGGDNNNNNVDDGANKLGISKFFSRMYDMLEGNEDAMLARRLMGLAQNLCQDDFGRSWFLR